MSGSGPWWLPYISGGSTIDHGGSPLSLEVRQRTLVAPHYQKKSGSATLGMVTRGSIVDHDGSTLSLEVTKWTIEVPRCH